MRWWVKGPPPYFAVPRRLGERALQVCGEPGGSGGGCKRQVRLRIFPWGLLYKVVGCEGPRRFLPFRAGSVNERFKSAGSQEDLVAGASVKQRSAADVQE